MRLCFVGTYSGSLSAKPAEPAVAACAELLAGGAYRCGSLFPVWLPCQEASNSKQNPLGKLRLLCGCRSYFRRLLLLLGRFVYDVLWVSIGEAMNIFDSGVN